MLGIFAGTSVGWWRGMLVVLLAGGASVSARADPDGDAGAPNCALMRPPADAGVYVTPGGFLLVHPRNAALSETYTGCKQVWVMRPPGDAALLMRVYFEQGRRTSAQAFDGHGGQTPVADCKLGDRSASCAGLDDNPLAALYLATWPRRCADDADKPECARDPE